MKAPGQFSATQRVHATWHVLFSIFIFLYLLLLQNEAILVSLAHISPALPQAIPAPVIHLLLTLLIYLATKAASARMHFPEQYYTCRFIPGAILAVAITQYPAPQHPAATLAASLLLLIAWLATGKGKMPRKQQTLLQACNSQALGLLLLCLYTGACGNSADTQRYELRTALLLAEGKTGKALSVGKKSLQTSPALTALRCYAMSQTKGGLPRHLFRQPISHGSHNLLLPPQEETYGGLFSPADSLHKRLGTSPRKGEQPLQYMERAAVRRQSPARDYWLCALLLDKKIDKFAAELPKYYPLNTPLPHYYAEAALLYQRLRTQPVLTYTDANIAANLQDFLEMKDKSYPTPATRSNLLRKQYGTTYWWYYFFGQ